MTAAVNIAQGGTNNVTMRNRIINGAMGIWQRGTSFTNTANTSQYTADRWSVFSGVGLAATSGQVASGLTAFPYALRCQRPNGSSATTNITLNQVIETVNCQDLAGQTITISFWARAGANYSQTSNALGVWIATGTGTDQGLTNMINSAWTGQVFNQNTVTLTTSFQKFTVTQAIPAGTNEIGILFITYPTGTAGANDYFDVTGVQIEAGTTATPFENRLYGTELMLCQRYYFGGAPLAGIGIGSGTALARVKAKLPVTMRAIPTLAKIGNPTVYNGAVPTTLTALTQNYSSVDCIEFDGNVASSMTTGTCVSFYQNYDGTTVTASAEL